MTNFIIALIAFTSAIALSTAQSCGESIGMRPNRKHDGDGRIVGGVEARPNSHPWIVSLQNYGSHFCGGALVRVGNANQTDIVVTAAHCIYDTRIYGLTATIGGHVLSSYPSSTEQILRAARMAYHPQYDPDSTINDIAVIKLERPIKFTYAVQPVCLPSPGEQVPEGTEGTVAGWGLTKEGDKSSSNTLMQVGVPVISSTSCSSSYAGLRIKIDPSAMLCAGYKEGGKDSCQGDSGGPFVCKSGSGYVLQGVVSFGVGCARPGVPGVYTRVSNYLGWIQSQIKTFTAVTK